ncbi:MAG: hypothetical protein CMJ65_06785 [Planctomycetaceae bacterium]|nr:hypothetical protein [Planctomycetaceae bacterium]
MPDAARPRSYRWLLTTLALVLVAAAAVAWTARSRLELRFGQQALDDLEFHDADSWARSILARDPGWHPGILLAGRAASGLRDNPRALQLLATIPDDGTATAIAARCAAGDILLSRQHRMSAAEEQFRRALQQASAHRIANDRLAYLLAVASRNWESISYRIRICRQDNFNPLHLKILAAGDGSLVDPEIIQLFHDADPADPGPLISMAWLALGDRDLPRAEAHLRTAIKTNPDLLEARVLLGSTLLQAGDDGGFLAWHADLPDTARRHPGIWNNWGRFAAEHAQPEVAARCFWEAVRRDPNHHQANYQLGQVLTQLGRPSQATPFLDRSRKINRYTTRIAAANATQRTGDMKLVVSLAEELGLVWEAFGWSQWVTQQDTTQRWAQQALRRLGPGLDSLEPARTLASANPVATIDLSDLPLPDWSARIANNSRLPRELPGVQVRFEDRAQPAGIAFRYFCGGDPNLSGPRYMYQMTGGGAAAIDFDLDGWPDLFLPQGGEFSDRNRQSTHLDRLFRNTGAGRFEDVTLQAGLVSNGFGQGQAVGDINGDGFPDLLVANIGGNRLYHNNGDGTYTDISGPAGISGDRWTTSCLLADLNNDGLPDLYAANFLSGKDVFTQECNRIRSPVPTEPLQPEAGNAPPAMRSGNCSPLDFPSAQDQLYLNLGDGRFREITAESGIQVPRGNGLGIVAADFSGNGRLNLFLANDSVPNFFFVHQGQGADGIPRFRERALPLGLAVNQDGRSEACMGVASGDADGDGRIDLYVTNFLNQSNTLYRKLAEQEFFADITQRAGLFESSVGLLGWGTQFVDADLDGQIDLVVTNGHVGQFPEQDTLFQMPTQYLHNTGQGRFVELPAKRLGSFFSQHALGRGMARLDWNRDGLDDVVISHIDAPLALLTCTSPTHGHYVALRLRATASARDAIGTRATLHVGDKRLYRQQTAGDGYMASNQRQLIFGTGSAKTVGPLEIHWPSGRRDRFDTVPIDCELILVEGRQPARVPR